MNKIFKVKINPEEFYETYFESKLEKVFSKASSTKLIASKQLKRLACLVHKCLTNKEPVLLVGETGCGKTSLCQLFASEVT